MLAPFEAAISSIHATNGDILQDINLNDLIELDEDATPAINAERCSQQAEFHAREVVDLTAAIQAGRIGVSSDDWSKDDRLSERQQHQQLEMICRELTASFEWLTSKMRPSSDLPRALEEIRANYDQSAEVRLLREIAETTYPLLSSIAQSRLNGVALLSETGLALRHAARGRPLSDTMTLVETETLLGNWLMQARDFQKRPIVYIPAVRQSIDWLVFLQEQRAGFPETRLIEDDLETLVYLARQTMDDAGFSYRAQELP